MSCWGKLSYFRPFQELLFKCLFTLDSVAQNSLISEFRASYVKDSCLYKKTVPITFFNHNTSSPAQPLISIFCSKPHHSAVSSTSLFYKKIQFSYNPKERCGFITTVMGDGNQCELLTLG